jgi:stage II sporulation protein D
VSSVVKKAFVIIIVVLMGSCFTSGQVRVRLYASENPSYATFSVLSGIYEINTYQGVAFTADSKSPVLLSKYNGKVIVKSGILPSVICDSLIISGKTGNDAFYLRSGGDSGHGKSYSGDLQCLPGLGTLLLVNIPDVETYIAGVVKSEGGSAKSIEYYKSQAILARTYMYKNINKHITDRFNLCDDIHCQAYDGFTTDSLIVEAALDTKGLVIMTPVNTLVISAFHSNCGGETSPAEFAWLTGQQYLQAVYDPYCRSSRNASWTLKMNRSEWTGYLSKSGFKDDPANPGILNFSQETRVNEYKAGSFSLPLRQIRSDLNLRSTFFSVIADGDSVMLNGRGYGHGVGLCQEGAMEMASKGFTFSQIIDFYYKGVIISDIKSAEDEIGK